MKVNSWDDLEEIPKNFEQELEIISMKYFKKSWDASRTLEERLSELSQKIRLKMARETGEILSKRSRPKLGKKAPPFKK